jgi:hypothetical protein
LKWIFFSTCISSISMVFPSSISVPNNFSMAIWHWLSHDPNLDIAITRLSIVILAMLILSLRYGCVASILCYIWHMCFF